MKNLIIKEEKINKEYLIQNGNIALVDADLLDNGTKFPNLVILKLSGFFKSNNNKVRLIENIEELTKDNYLGSKKFDAIFISKVFEFTKIDEKLLKLNNVYYGGTGFFYENAQPLPEEIEHFKPDYNIYDEFIKHDTTHTKEKNYWKDYQKYSIGFATRGCFRKCSFCVNKKYDRVMFHSHINEFLDEKRPYIYLLDDNILGYSRWKEVFQELKETKKAFQFKQGMDIRLITEEKAKILNDCKYYGDLIFAFDHIEDKEIIEKKLQLWRKFCKKSTKLYVLSGYAGIDEKEIESVFERIRILMNYGCLPYIMRHKNYLNSPYKNMFVQIARWCNQPAFFKKTSFREFIELSQSMIKKKNTKCKGLKTLEEFEAKFPDIANKYFNMKFEETEYFKKSKGEKK